MADTDFPPKKFPEKFQHILDDETLSVAGKLQAAGYSEEEAGPVLDFVDEFREKVSCHDVKSLEELGPRFGVLGVLKDDLLFRIAFDELINIWQAYDPPEPSR